MSIEYNVSITDCTENKDIKTHPKGVRSFYCYISLQIGLACRKNNHLFFCKYGNPRRTEKNKSSRKKNFALQSLENKPRLVSITTTLLGNNVNSDIRQIAYVRIKYSFKFALLDRICIA